MAHPQSTPRGYEAHKRVDVGAQQLTDGTTHLALNLGIKPGLLTAAPATRYGPGVCVMVGNSTGNMIAINTTGTTWAYLNVTSVLA